MRLVFVMDPVSTVLVDEDGGIIAGHGRVLAAQWPRICEAQDQDNDRLLDQFAGGRFQPGDDLGHLIDLGDRDAGDPGPAIRQKVEQAFGRENLDRLAQRRPGNPESGGKLPFVEP